jgi:hypothetical protein
MFSTDTRGYNEDKKKRNPSAILVPEEGQGNPAVVPDWGDNAHQLRTLIPQKDTYSINAIRNRRNTGTTSTDEEGDYWDDHNPDAKTKSEIYDRVACNITHVQLMLAILERAWPPSMQFRMLNPTPLMTTSKLRNIVP